MLKESLVEDGFLIMLINTLAWIIAFIYSVLHQRKQNSGQQSAPPSKQAGA